MQQCRSNSKPMAGTGFKMVRQQWQRVPDGEAAVAMGFKYWEQQWQRVQDGETTVAEGLRQ